MSACTLKILEIDGGGERGYIPSQWLLRFIRRWGIDPATLWQQFDMICGASVGGMLALAYAAGIDPNTIDLFFTEKGPYVFTIRSNPLTCSFGGISGNSPSNTPNLAQKLAFITAEEPFYATGGGCTTYGSTYFYNTLTDLLGTTTLQDLKTNVVIPAYQPLQYDVGWGKSGVFRYFSNLNLPYLTGQNELAVNVAKATSAAPVYLPAVTFGGNTYMDGGLYNNNPAQVALNAMMAIKPLATKACVLSLGTGLGSMQFVDDGSVLPSQRGITRAVSNLFSLFDISSTGAQEAVNVGLQLVASNTLTNLYTYRFQPTLDPALDTGLDNTSPEILAYYRTVAETSFNNDLPAIDNFLGHLMA